MDPLTLGIIALVVGAATGTLNAIGNNSDINNQISQLTTDQEYLEQSHKEEMANLNLEKKQKEESWEQNYYQTIEKATQDYEAAKAERKLSFQNAAAAANKQADKSDREATLSEKNVSSQFNNEINSLILSQAAAGTAYNNQAVQNGQTKGNALSTQAASGTRSSSMNTAIDLEAATNAAQLQQAQDQQRQNEALQLNSLITAAAANTFNIGEARRDALDLRGQYVEGGSKYNEYVLQNKNAKNSYELQTQQLYKDWQLFHQQSDESYWQQYDINKNKYDYQNKKLQTEIDDLNNNRWLDNTTAFFKGFNVGSSTVGSWGNLV